MTKPEMTKPEMAKPEMSKHTSVRSIFKTPQLGRHSQAVAFLLVLGLLGAMAIQPTRQLMEQRRRISEMKSDLGNVQTANANLHDLIKRLNDPDFIEQRAREQVGLVHQGEVAYAVVAPGQTAREQRRQARRRQRIESPPPPEPGFFEGMMEFVGLN